MTIEVSAIELCHDNAQITQADPNLRSSICHESVNPITHINEDEKKRIMLQHELWPNVVTQSNHEKLKLYNIVRSAGTYNVLAARQIVPSQLKIDGWFANTTGHVDDEWVIEMIMYGFPLQYNGPSDPHNGVELANHSSATAYNEHIDRFVKSELECQTLIGPFDNKPFDWCSIAPIMTRPKSDPTKRRIIVDFSYPENQGINAFIDKNMVFGTYVEHRLPSVNDAVECVKSYDFAVTLATIDLERAYRNFRIDPLDWPLTCIRHRNRYYVDTGVPFGSRLSSLYMQKIAQFVERALLSKGITMIMYLDDGLAIIPDHHDAHQVLLSIITLIRDLGLPLAYDKVQMPSKRCRFLGIILDVENRCLEIPHDKITEFLTQVKDIQSRDKITRKQLQSLIGSINHLGKAVSHARLFMNRLLESLRDAETSVIPICDQIRADLNWFVTFLSAYNGKTMIITGQPAMVIEADSCLIGAGATNGQQCYKYVYPASFKHTYHITQLEAINCLMAVRRFAAQYRNSIIEVRCDNLAAINTFTHSRGRDKVLNAITRALWYFAANNNLELRYTHIPGVDMHVADTLSRAGNSPESDRIASQLIKDKGLSLIKITPRYHDFNTFF